VSKTYVPPGTLQAHHRNKLSRLGGDNMLHNPVASRNLYRIIPTYVIHYQVINVLAHDRLNFTSWQNCDSQLMRSDTSTGRPQAIPCQANTIPPQEDLTLNTETGGLLETPHHMSKCGIYINQILIHH